jgi:hypothetical protein
MNGADQERSEVLVLRVWVEAGSALRVRITRITPYGSAEPSTSATATVDGACAVVRNWLEEVLRG